MDRGLCWSCLLAIAAAVHLRRVGTAAVPAWVAARRLRGLLLVLLVVELQRLGIVGLVLLGSLEAVHVLAESVCTVGDTAEHHCRAGAKGLCLDTGCS